jgi:glycosyltransferase involved in cell wall biosynthesis
MVDVSVIIPTFRRPEPLLEAIQSALRQPNVEVEVLVSDDSPEGSAKETLAKLDDPRVHYSQTKTPSGGNPAFPRNDAWPKAKGRYVHFLDDDDRAAPGAYAVMVAALDAAPDRGVAFGRVAPFSSDPAALKDEERFFTSARRRARLATKLGPKIGFVSNLLFRPTLLVNSACMIRRECIEPLGGYDPDCVVVEDVDFYHRAIRRYGAVFVDRDVLEYRIAPSLMHGNDAASGKVLKAFDKMYAKYRNEYGEVEFRLLQVLARTVFQWM